MESKVSGRIDLRLFLLIELVINFLCYILVQLSQLIILRKLLYADRYLGNLIQLWIYCLVITSGLHGYLVFIFIYLYRQMYVGF